MFGFAMRMKNITPCALMMRAEQLLPFVCKGLVVSISLCKGLAVLISCHIFFFFFTQKKCEEYWPGLGAERDYGSIYVTGLDVQKRADYVIRTFDIKENSVSNCQSEVNGFVTAIRSLVSSSLKIKTDLTKSISMATGTADGDY